jgi:hypothetical protein
MGGVAARHVKEITDLAKELPDSSLEVLLDFAQFLKTKRGTFSYKQVADSAEHVRDLRVRQGKKTKSAQAFLKELLEWQKSNS